MLNDVLAYVSKTLKGAVGFYSCISINSLQYFHPFLRKPRVWLRFNISHFRSMYRFNIDSSVTTWSFIAGKRWSSGCWFWSEGSRCWWHSWSSLQGCQSSQCFSFGLVQGQEGETKIINLDQFAKNINKIFDWKNFSACYLRLTIF